MNTPLPIPSFQALWNDEYSEHDHNEVFIASGKGAWVTDQYGHRMFEGTSGHSCLNLGHANEEIIQAAARSFRNLSYCSPEHVSGPIAKLSLKLAELLGADYRIKYAATGGGANDLAIEIAKRHWRHAGRESKRGIISLDRSYHGSSGASSFASGYAKYRSPHAETDQNYITIGTARDFARGVTRGLQDIKDEFIACVEHYGSETIAAIILEPICFVAGVVLPPAGYLETMSSLCRKYDILLIADEIISGFGRTGRWFGYQHEADVFPDIVSLGKGMTAAYFPLTAAAVKASIYESFLEHGNALNRIITMAGHPVGCDIALKNIEIMERDDLVSRVRRNSELHLSRLNGLKDFRCVRDIRGIGHMWGVEFQGSGDDVVKSGSLISREVGRLCLERGLIIVGAENVLRLNPPLVSTEDELDFVVDTLRGAVKDVESAGVVHR